MTRSLILALLLCATAQAQFMPFAMWRTASASFDPASIDTLRLWLKADAITGKSSGDTVYRWPASVGGDAFQLTAARKPIYYADSVGGKPSVKFDGSDDAMISSTVLNSGSGTVFIVVKAHPVNASTNPGYIISYHDPAGLNYQGGCCYYWAADSTGYSGRVGSYASAWKASASYTYLTPQIVTSRLSGTVSAMYINGAIGTQKTTAASALGGLYVIIGAQINSSTIADAAKAHISEVLVYTTALSDTDRGKVETYLKAKYGI